MSVFNRRLALPTNFALPVAVSFRFPWAEELNSVIRGNQDMLHPFRYRLLATRGKHDFQHFPTMRGMYLQSEETESTVMAYVEISKPGNREVGDDCPGLKGRSISLRYQDQLAVGDQEGTGRRKLSFEGSVHGRPLDGG
jgi:hypothetical protein